MRTKQLNPTTREIEVLMLLLHFVSYNEIADELCISMSTVKKHKENAFAKMKFKTMDDLFRFAVEEGVLRSSRCRCQFPNDEVWISP